MYCDCVGLKSEVENSLASYKVNFKVFSFIYDSGNTAQERAKRTTTRTPGPSSNFESEIFAPFKANAQVAYLLNILNTLNF